MEDSEAVTKLLVEIGEDDSRIDTILQTGPRLWLLRRDDVAIELELDGDGIRLMLSADLGAASPSQAAAIHSTALRYTLLWQETGGCRIALSEPTGSLFLMVDLLLPGLDRARFATALGNFARNVTVWRRYVAGELDDNEAALSTDFNLIRV